MNLTIVLIRGELQECFIYEIEVQSMSDEIDDRKKIDYQQYEVDGHLNLFTFAIILIVCIIAFVLPVIYGLRWILKCPANLNSENLVRFSSELFSQSCSHSFNGFNLSSSAHAFCYLWLLLSRFDAKIKNAKLQIKIYAS